MAKQHSRYLFSLVLLLTIIASISLGGAFFWWSSVTKAVNPSDTTHQKVIIPKGYGVSEIGILLKEQGLIKNDLAFKLLVKKEGLGTQLQAGSYILSKSQSMLDIAHSLTKGMEDFWVTIPEGKRREEVVKIFYDEFLKQGLVLNIDDFMVQTKQMEGYLFPDTYSLPKTANTTEVVDVLRHTFDQKISDEYKVKSAKIGLNFQQVLILASLVEREAKFAADRPKIARIYLNRLKQDMPLQVDATVQYALGSQQCARKLGDDCNWWPQITNTSLSSPYNTYENPGLPPAPICNPGKAVLDAVLNPDNNDYLYYLSEPNGTTHYAKTLTEHEENIRKYLD